MEEKICECCEHFLTKNCEKTSTDPEFSCDDFTEMNSIQYNPEFDYQVELGNIPKDDYWNDVD